MSEKMRVSRSILKVLVVDDQYIMRAIISKRVKEFLKDKVEHDVLIATGYEQAIKLIFENKINIIFTDLQMDGDSESGYRLTRRIKAINPDSRVFITSNTLAAYIETDALNAGATGCIQLPIESYHLENAFCDYI